MDMSKYRALFFSEAREHLAGMGRLLVTSTLAQDYPVVQVGILVIAIAVVFANFLVDICYGWLDPRIRYD